jgi:hypothetical protein
MMNPEDILRQMTGGMERPHQIQVSKEEMDKKVDTFIDRCLNERNYDLQSLGWEINYMLNPPHGSAPVMLQVGMVEVFPLILKRIQERMS